MEFLGALVPLVILGAIIAGVVSLIRRGQGGREAAPSTGGDIIAYLLLALAYGVAAFSLAELGQAAFPGGRGVVGSTGQVAAALAGIVVATPIAVLLWRRQARRREEFPKSGGWTSYLAVMEAIFLGALVVAAVSILNWLLGDGDTPTWTDVLVFGGVVVFHEWASKGTPPRSEAADLPRVVGSAIGLITIAIGAAGVLFWIFEKAYSTMAATVAGSELGLWVSILVVGVPVWWYRWLRTWDDDLGTPRKAWTAIATIGGLTGAIGAGVFTITQTLVYLFTDAGPAGSHFDFLPAALAVGFVTALIWLHHARKLGEGRTDRRRAYEYAMAALGLGGAVGGATSLSVAAFSSERLVTTGAELVIVALSLLVAALLLWWYFWSRATKAPRLAEVAAGPRHVYLLGLGVVMGLTAAGALIATLVVLFQELLGAASGSSIALQASLFVFAGAATWHLLRTNAQDRELIAEEVTVAPFDVTVIGSDLGPLGEHLPEEAHLRLITRGDGIGVVDEPMAAEIAEAVGQSDSLVWVDSEGYRVAPAG